MRRHKIFPFLAYGLFLFLLAELGARSFWALRRIAFLSAQAKMHWIFYPQLRRFQEAHSQRCEDCIEILLLGGSALMPRWGSIELALREKVSQRTGKLIRVFNLAGEAHTSLDSYYKYRRLRNRSFDLVILYDGFNEVRANSCPREFFRNDYSHYSWYKLLGELESRGGTGCFVLPYTIKYVAINYFGWGEFVPTDRPPKEWLEQGCDVKTTSSFRANIEGILRLAAEKGEPLVLMSYSFYLPSNYSEEKFRSRALDYTTHTLPIELWGKPACVAKGVEAHNAVLKELAGRWDNVAFVDQQQLIPKEGRFFNDVCHLTMEGSERFVNNILEPVLDHLRVRDSDPKASR